MTSATKAWSPTSPTTSGTDFGIAERKPVDRSSMTTTRLAGIRQRMHHVAADIAAAAGDQDGHEPDPLAI